MWCQRSALRLERSKLRLQSLEHVALHALKEGCFVLEKDEVDDLVKTSGGCL